jgi:gamma-glutamylcyclotransferase (GGCT)/AIG2-like uncharacterized protein YtfP
VGYGTFITKGHWKDKENVETCIVKDFIRIYPKTNWFPFILPAKGNSFKALKFDVEKGQLNALDLYEGVSANLYDRVETQVFLKNNDKINAFIYVPTQETIESQGLTPEMDKNDSWKEEIKKIPEIVKKFPELIL